MKGVKITTDKQLSWVDVNELADYQAVVGGYIERVELEDGCSLWLNEEGKLNRLPFNSIATDIALPRLMFGDTIVGDVVILGPDDGEGNDTDLDQRSATMRRIRLVASEAGGCWLDPRSAPSAAAEEAGG